VLWVQDEPICGILGTSWVYIYIFCEISTLEVVEPGIPLSQGSSLHLESRPPTADEAGDKASQSKPS